MVRNLLHNEPDNWAYLVYLRLLELECSTAYAEFVAADIETNCRKIDNIHEAHSG
jgi:hypothetical protein